MMITSKPKKEIEMVSILLAHARSGSSELARAVTAATKVPFLMEPFHRSMVERNISFDSPQFENYLDEVMQARFIKHLWNGISPDNNKRILQHQSVKSVVLLERKDTISAALSVVVAQAYGKYRGAVAETLNDPLPIDEIEKRSEIFKGGQKRARNWLNNLGIPHLVVAYEDIYDPQATVDKRKENLAMICGVLGFTCFNLEKGAIRLDTSNKYNKDELYKSAPNWSDFKKRFKL